MKRSALAVVLISSLIGMHPSATYAVACQSPSAHQFDGTRSTSQIFAASGSIIDRPIVVCGDDLSDLSSASVWIMFAGGGDNEYAQAGYLRLAGWSSPMAFEEYNDGSNNHPGWQPYYFGTRWTSGRTHSYKVDYSEITGKIYIYIDGAQRFSPPWSPETSWGSPWEAQFMGETENRGDDVPGTDASRVTLSNLAVKRCPTCAWTNPPNTSLFSMQSYYKNVWVSQPTSFRIWTQR